MAWVRRSASHDSTAANRSVPNSRSRTTRRSSGPARRKVAKSPWGRSTTVVNCWASMPSSPDSRWPASSSREASGSQRPSTSSRTRTDACSVVVPVPRALGRVHAGERRTSIRRLPTVSSHSTAGCDARRRVVAAQRGVPQRGPRARHHPVEREADGVEQAGLARAGGPVQQEEPVLGQGVEVDVDPVGERPERLDRDPVQPHASTSSRRTCSSAARSRSRSAGDAGRPRTSARKAQQTSSSSRPATRST